MKNLLFIILFMQIFTSCKINQKNSVINVPLDNTKGTITVLSDKDKPDIIVYQTDKKYKNQMYDNTNNNIFGRHVIKRPKINDDLVSKEGKIVFKVCIDYTGEPTFIKVINEKSTIKNKDALIEGVKYLSKFKWQEIENKELEQCGNYTVIIERD